MAKKLYNATQILEIMLAKHKDVVMDKRQLEFVTEAMRMAVFQMYIDSSLGQTPEAKQMLREYNKYILEKSKLLGFGIETGIGLYE